MAFDQTHKIAGNPWDDIDIDNIQDENIRKVLERIIRLSHRDYDRFFELAQTTLFTVEEVRRSVDLMKNAIVGEPELQRPGLSAEFLEVKKTVKEIKEWQNKVDIDTLDSLEKDIQELKRWKETGVAIRLNDDRRIDWLHKLWPFFYIAVGIILALLSKGEAS